MVLSNLIKKRPIVVTIAVLALVVLSAGVVSAASAKAKFDASGIVQNVGLAPGGSVESNFKYKKNGAELNKIEINTVGEAVAGFITEIPKCEEKGKHSEGVCDDVTDALLGNAIISVHSSSAVLKVTQQPAVVTLPLIGDVEVVKGKLKGELAAGINVAELPDLFPPTMTGTGSLKIRSTKGTESTYACLITILTNTPKVASSHIPVFGPIAACEYATGAITLGVTPYVLVGGVPVPAELIGGVLTPVGPEAIVPSPVMVPIDLQVTDTGSFEVSELGGDLTVKGKLKVIVDSTLGVPTTGTIEIKNGKATVGDVD
jgi:hypothetical protein